MGSDRSARVAWWPGRMSYVRFTRTENTGSPVSDLAGRMIVCSGRDPTSAVVIGAPSRIEHHHAALDRVGRFPIGEDVRTLNLVERIRLRRDGAASDVDGFRALDCNVLPRELDLAGLLHQQLRR